ncbi:MAG: hypothetical protein AB7Q97_16730 [Gammaproteobacteria bacterium]
MNADPFASGRAAADDLPLAGPHPKDPAVLETFVVWLHDRARDTGVELRIHAQGGVAQGRAMVFLPGGRILHAGPESAPIEDPRTPQTAHVSYACLEPFRRWQYRLCDYDMLLTGDEAHARGQVAEGRTARVSLDFQATAVAPIWLQGELLPEAREAVKGPAGLWIACRLAAGPDPSAFRYDQALSARGTITVDGQSMPFEGHGLRGHVRGVRAMAGFKAHTWVGAVFPETGRAVGLQCHIHHDAPGGYAFSEAYVWQGGVMHPNRIIYAPPVARADPHGEFVIELACDALGLTRLRGQDDRVSWISMSAQGLGGTAGGKPIAGAQHVDGGRGLLPGTPRAMSQSLASFDWDGDPGYGLCERSG